MQLQVFKKIRFITPIYEGQLNRIICFFLSHKAQFSSSLFYLLFGTDITIEGVAVLLFVDVPCQPALLLHYLSSLTLLASVHHKSTRITLKNIQRRGNKQTSKQKTQSDPLPCFRKRAKVERDGEEERQTERGSELSSCSPVGEERKSKRPNSNHKSRSPIFFSVDESKILCGARVSLCGMHLNETLQRPAVHVIVYI